MKQHLLIIIDNNNEVDPKKYTQDILKSTKEAFIQSSKKLYEKNHNNFAYESYYFLNEIT